MVKPSEYCQLSTTYHSQRSLWADFGHLNIRGKCYKLATIRGKQWQDVRQRPHIGIIYVKIWFCGIYRFKGRGHMRYSGFQHIIEIKLWLHWGQGGVWGRGWRLMQRWKGSNKHISWHKLFHFIHQWDSINSKSWVKGTMSSWTPEYIFTKVLIY